MRLYHGSNQDFSIIDFSKSKDKRDFGKGFYLTTIREQALDWGQTILSREGGKGIFLYEFEFTFNKQFRIKRFPKISDAWFDFVLKNRTIGGLQHNFDVVRGPVANDKTTRIISNYIEGVYTKKEAIKRLKYNKTNDQVSLHTEIAIKSLALIEKNKIPKEKLIFNGQDITLDVMIKIEHIISIMSKRENKSFEDIYKKFVSSKTYSKLQNANALMWAESAEFIVDEYYREKN